jgi:sodium transport system ATP-binding protein
MIEVRQLAKTFALKGHARGTVTALRDVTFDAADGRITGLLGPNGAGKSTSLRILAGLLKPDSGLARIDGRDAITEPLAARRALGFLPHSAGLYPRLTARETLEYYARLCGLGRKDADRRAGELIHQLDMRAFADRRTQGFSQGQRTKVALGRALIHKPGNLILDEPTNGLDVMATRGIRTILKRLRDEGHCVLVSSHVMQEVARLCDRAAIINDGMIAMADSVDGILTQTGCRDLEDAFVAAIGARP